MTTPPLPEPIELHGDRMWRRDEALRVQTAVDAERFIEDVGFANTRQMRVAQVHRCTCGTFAKRTNLIAGGKALYGELLASGANVQGEPVSRPWGLREFRVVDPEGNQLAFRQPFE